MKEKDKMNQLAQAYLYFFGILHIISRFFGAQVIQFGSIGSALFLILVLGAGTIFVTWRRHRLLLWAYAILYVIGWCIEFTEYPQWVIPWRHDQYLLLASMNAIAAICLIYLALHRTMGEKNESDN